MSAVASFPVDLLADMRRTQDELETRAELDAHEHERRAIAQAEAAALFGVAVQLHDRAIIGLEAAQDRLANAIDDAVEASATFDRVTSMVLAAAQLVATLRGERP